MADNKGTVIFLAIVAIGALGLSGYLFTMDLLTEEEEQEYGNLKLVALWNDLDENLTNNALHSQVGNFLVEYDDQMVLDTNYVNVINNTRFKLLVPGFYKINLNLILGTFTEDGRIYWVEMLANNTHAGYFERYESENPMVENYLFISSSVYINHTNTENYYEINARSNNVAGAFYVATDSSTPDFHQLSIEYVIE